MPAPIIMGMHDDTGTKGGKRNTISCFSTPSIVAPKL